MISSLVQLITPNEMRGRVMSVYNVAFRGGMPFGSITTGWLVPIFTAPTVLSVNGLLSAYPRRVFFVCAEARSGVVMRVMMRHSSSVDSACDRCVSRRRSVGSDDLEHLRDRQDRAGLDARAAALQAAAEKTPNDATDGTGRRSHIPTSRKLPWKCATRPAPSRPRKRACRDAQKAIELNGKNADYYRVLGTLCGQVIPANPIVGALVVWKAGQRGAG